MAKAAATLKTFNWRGTDKRGKKTSGEITGASLAIVKATLRKQGISASKVTRKKASLFGPRKKAITSNDITLFTRQLSTMMRAGVPLVQAFDIVAEGVDNISVRDLIYSIKNNIASGTNFADALRKHPRHFDDLYCNLVESGEKSGALESLLDRLATYKEKSESLRKKIKKAMTYPIAVVVVAIVVTAILLVKVVPTFKDMFDGFGADLPAFTQFVVGISETMQEWWFIVLIIIVSTIFIFKEAKLRSKKVADATDRVLLKMPIVGDILLQSIYARYARTLATTFAAGVPLVEALESTAGACGNVVYYDAVMKIQSEVSTGQQLNFAMRNAGVFPNMLIQMASIGEESGALDEMLDKAASFFEEEVDNAVDNLTALMEPMIMAVLGILIGGLIIAMYLPIFKMGNVV